MLNLKIKLLHQTVATCNQKLYTVVEATVLTIAQCSSFSQKLFKEDLKHTIYYKLTSPWLLLLHDGSCSGQRILDLKSIKHHCMTEARIE